MNQEVVDIIELFQQYEITVKYDKNKGYHVVRKSGRDAYVYIQFMNGVFGIKFMDNWHYPNYLENELDRIKELIAVTKKANEILQNHK